VAFNYDGGGFSQTNKGKNFQIIVNHQDLLAVELKIENISREMIDDTMDEFYKLTQEFESSIKLQMENTPRDYTRGRRVNGKIHFPSLPGHAPAVMTGKYINSIKDFVNPIQKEAGVYVPMRVPYPPHLEWAKRIAPRPLWEPTIKRFPVGDRVFAAIKAGQRMRN